MPGEHVEEGGGVGHRAGQRAGGGQADGVACRTVEIFEAFGLADRLVASGHIVRGGDPHHRSVVTLALSPAGRRLVTEVLNWRRAELARILARLGPEQRAATAAGMRALHRVIGETYTAELHGPVPL